MWGNNPAYATRVVALDGSSDVQTQTDFDTSGAFAPLLWLGYMTPAGIGARVRWWQFQTKSDTPAITLTGDDTTSNSYISSAYPMGIGFAAQYTPGQTDTMSFGSELDMTVADMEIIWELHPAVRRCSSVRAFATHTLPKTITHPGSRHPTIRPS